MSTASRPVTLPTIAPDVLVIGNICIDRAHRSGGTEEALGGGSAYATQVAVRAGYRPAMVTAAPDLTGRLAALAADPRVALHVKPSETVNLFEVVWPPGQKRRERVLSRACPLVAADIPQAWRHAPVAYVGPILGECDGPLVAELGCRCIAVGAQGWLRQLDDQGWIVEAETEAFKAPPANVNIMIFSEEDHPDGEAEARRLARRGILTVLTRGALGGQVFVPDGSQLRYAPVQAVERDATGAGDTFGCVFALAISRRLSPGAAAALAAEAAARVVEGPEMGALTEVRWPNLDRDARARLRASVDRVAWPDEVSGAQLQGRAR